MRKALLITTALLAILLSACSNSGLKAKGEQNPEPTSTPTPRFVYTPHYVDVNGEAESLFPICITDEGYYAYKIEKVGENIPDVDIVEAKKKGEEVKNDGRYDVFETSLFFISNEGNSQKLDKYVPLDDEENENGWKSFKSVKSICTAAEGVDNTLYLLERTYVSGSSAPDSAKDWEKGRDYREFETNYYIRQINKKTGEILSSHKIKNETGLILNDSSIKCADDKILCIYNTDEDSGIALIDKEGNITISSPCKGKANKLLTLSDGTYALLWESEQGNYISSYHMTDGTFEDLFLLSDDTDEVFDGNGDYTFSFNSKNSLIAYNGRTLSDEKWLSWENIGINKGNIVSDIHVSQNGSLSFILRDNGSSSMKLAVIERNDFKDKDGTTLYLYTGNSTYNLQEIIANYNLQSENVKIEITDNLAYADIIDLKDLDFRKLSAQGSFEDLYPYIEKDSEIKKSDFMPNVLKCAESDGKLYRTVSGFSINTCVGAVDIVGKGTSWDYNQFLNIKTSTNLDPFAVYTTRDDVFDTLLALDLDWFVDFEQSYSNFNNDNFASMLELANTFPESFDTENYVWDDERDNSDLRIYNGKQYLQSAVLYSFEDVCRAGFEFDKETSFIGLPTNNGCGSTFTISSLDVGQNFAMSSSCRDKDAAWRFLRLFFTSDYQEKLSYFPLNQEIFTRKMEDYRLEYLVDEDGEFIVDKKTDEIKKRAIGAMYLSDYTEVLYYGMDGTEIEEFMNLINSITKTDDCSKEIFNIVKSRCKDYFNGKMSSAEMSAEVQNSVMEYLSNVSVNKK